MPGIGVDDTGAIHVLLTAAVTPAGGVSVAVADPEERLRQYQYAARWWAEAAEANSWGIWLLETSGHDGSGLIEALPDPSGFLSLPGSVNAARRGKGALEADAIDAAVALLQERGVAANDTIYKVTGRLWMENAGRILRPAGPGEIVGRRRIDRTDVDTRLIGAQLETWRRTLHGMGAEVDEAAGRYVEHVVAHRIFEAEYHGSATMGTFAERVTFAGVSGTRGVAFGSVRERSRAAFGRPAAAVGSWLSESVYR